MEGKGCFGIIDFFWRNMDTCGIQDCYHTTNNQLVGFSLLGIWQSNVVSKNGWSIQCTLNIEKTNVINNQLECLKIDLSISFSLWLWWWNVGVWFDESNNQLLLVKCIASLEDSSVNKICLSRCSIKISIGNIPFHSQSVDLDTSISSNVCQSSHSLGIWCIN